MTQQFTWSEATRGDVKRLQKFTCTTKAKFDRGLRRRIHAKPWELGVQSFIRDLHLPAPVGEFVLLGEDKEGLAAVACGSRVDGPQDVFLRALAIETRHRGGDGALASAMMEELLDRVIQAADLAGHTEITITAKVHPENRASLALAGRIGAVYDESDSDGHEIWVLAIELESADIPSPC